jgi:hypothetical protein
MYFAALGGNLEIVEDVLKVKSEQSWTGKLLEAKNPFSFRELLRKYDCYHEFETKEAIMLAAVYANNPAVVKALLPHFPVFAVNKNIVSLACSKSGNVDIVKMLWECTTWEQRSKALEIAVVRGHDELGAFLLEKTNQFSRDLLFTSISAKCPTVLKMLLEKDGSCFPFREALLGVYDSAIIEIILENRRKQVFCFDGKLHHSPQCAWSVEASFMLALTQVSEEALEKVLLLLPMMSEEELQDKQELLFFLGCRFGNVTLIKQYYADENIAQSFLRSAIIDKRQLTVYSLLSLGVRPAYPSLKADLDSTSSTIREMVANSKHSLFL